MRCLTSVSAERKLPPTLLQNECQFSIKVDAHLHLHSFLSVVFSLFSVNFGDRRPLLCPRLLSYKLAEPDALNMQTSDPFQRKNTTTRGRMFANIVTQYKWWAEWNASLLFLTHLTKTSTLLCNGQLPRRPDPTEHNRLCNDFVLTKNYKFRTLLFPWFDSLSMKYCLLLSTKM